MGERRADIQGLRAVAVSGVIAAHVFDWPRGGYLGVDVFFVVSGFVITGVLLRERERTGRTSLTAFYARRARRILPLALLVLALTVLVAQWAFAPAKADGVRADAVWAALFTANWHFAAVGADYFQLGQLASPVQHFWSLGVEEQFYLVWPWLFVLVAGAAGAADTARSSRHGVRTPRRWGIVGVTTAVAAASLAWAAAQAQSDALTAYYSSLTRAWELALGALLAAVPAYAVRLGPRARSAMSWAGLAGVATSFLVVGEAVGSPFPAAVVPVLSTLVILVAGVGARAPGAVLLSNPVSRYLGDISYGLYLWHFPLIAVGTTVLAAGPAQRLMVVAATVVLAAISYHLLERPVLDAPRLRMAPAAARREAWRSWWVSRRRGMVTALTALAVIGGSVAGVAAAEPGAFQPTAAAVVPSDNGAVPPPPTSPPTPSRSTTSAPTTPTTTAPTPTPSPTQTRIPLGRTGRAIQAGLSEALAASSWPSRLNPPTDAWQDTAIPDTADCLATDAGDPDACTFGNTDGPEIVVYGDSLGIPLLATVVAAYGKTHKVRGLTKLACAVNGVDADFGKDEWATPCDRHREMTVAYVKKHRPEVLIMTENYAWATKLKSGRSGAAAGAEWLKADQAFVDSVKRSVGRVVVVVPSMPGVAFLDCYRAGGSPGRCVTGIPDWWRAVRDAERRIKDATFVDTLHWFCVEGRCPIFTGTDNTVVKGDYLHVSRQYARLVAADLAYRLDYAGVFDAR